MIIQTLDIKDNCTDIFSGGKFIFQDLEDVVDQCSIAWKHSPALEEEKYTYIYLIAKSDDLSSYSTDPDLFLSYRQKLSAHHKAALSAKVSLDDTCFFDLLPEHQLTRWFSMRQNCLENVYERKPKPSDYDILHKAHVLTTNISFQDLIRSCRLQKVVLCLSLLYNQVSTKRSC